MHPKDAEGIANTVCPDLSVQKLRNITVVKNHDNLWNHGKQTVNFKVGSIMLIQESPYITYNSNIVMYDIIKVISGIKHGEQKNH